jgi:hypothetical protein
MSAMKNRKKIKNSKKQKHCIETSLQLKLKSVILQVFFAKSSIKSYYSSNNTSVVTSKNNNQIFRFIPLIQFVHFFSPKLTF